MDKDSSTLLVRVWLFGAFQVECRNEAGIWETSDKSHWEKGYTRPLFKRLLSSGGRRLERLTLIDDLWPNPDSPERVERYLNDAAYQLRKTLRPAQVLKTFGHASGYELANQSLLWVDADACEALLKEAERIGRTYAFALPLLEQARAYFARGDFLEGESGLWVYARRGTLERLHYRCRIWLAEAYEQQGLLGQAEMLYSGLLEESPSDEDVLCRLMGLLHRQGMTHAALRCYEETKKHLKLLGQRLSPTTDVFAKHLLSEPRQVELYGGKGTQQLLSAEGEQYPISPSFPPNTRSCIEGDTHRVDINQASLRSQALDQLSERVSSTGTDKETLDFFAKLTEICWQLSKGNDLDTAEHVLQAYLPKMVSLALPPSQQQQTIAGIASSGYLLAASLAGHHNDLKARQNCSEQALLFGDIAQDRNLQIAAMRQLAATFDYQDRPYKVLETYQQVLPYLGEVSPLLRSRIYAGTSGIYAQLGCEQEALRFLSLAYEDFPENPERDPSFLFADCGYFTLVLWDGLTHLELHQPCEAAEAFARIDGLQPKIQVPERVRAEILHHQATTFTDLRQMDQACDYLEAAVKASLILGSERRYREAFEVFTQMRPIWISEKRVQSLGDFFKNARLDQ